jgi:hypothetical protein
MARANGAAKLFEAIADRNLVAVQRLARARVAERIRLDATNDVGYPFVHFAVVQNPPFLEAAVFLINAGFLLAPNDMTDTNFFDDTPRIDMKPIIMALSSNTFIKSYAILNDESSNMYTEPMPFPINYRLDFGDNAFRVLETRPDGNCLFEALSYFRYSQRYTLPYLDRRNATQMREDICDYIAAHSDLAAFNAGDMPRGCKPPYQKLSTPGETIKRGGKVYRISPKDLSTEDPEWAGSIAIFAAAQMFRVRIVVLKWGETKRGEDPFVLPRRIEPGHGVQIEDVWYLLYTGDLHYEICEFKRIFGRPYNRIETVQRISNREAREISAPPAAGRSADDAITIL